MHKEIMQAAQDCAAFMHRLLRRWICKVSDAKRGLFPGEHETISVSFFEN